MQEFEKYPKLTTYIEKLASYGSCLSGSEWNAFLAALNEALKISSNPLLCDSVCPSCQGQLKATEFNYNECEDCGKTFRGQTVA